MVVDLQYMAVLSESVVFSYVVLRCVSLNPLHSKHLGRLVTLAALALVAHDLTFIKHWATLRSCYINHELRCLLLERLLVRLLLKLLLLRLPLVLITSSGWVSCCTGDISDCWTEH